jgi:uncharacterized membrane protein YedE/YeeE
MTGEMTVFEIFVAIMQIPGAPLKIGTIIAVAMIVGFVFVDSYSALVKILLGMGVFIIAHEWMNYLIIVEIAEQPHPISTPLISASFVSLLFVIGLSFGGVLGYNATKRVSVMEHAGESVIVEIENGGLKVTK